MNSLTNRQNSANCAQMAESAEGEPAYNRFKRMEAAWLALAEEQDWLDGEQRPAGRPRTPADDDLLRELLVSGMKPWLIAQRQKRSIGAIQTRIFLFKALEVTRGY
jgi:hypothetical protein